MKDTIPFIGRRTELEVINELIADYGGLHIICITAPGGIGKSRLLRQVHQVYEESNDDHLMVSNILDFDNRNLRDAHNVERAIVQMFNKTAFEPYYKALEDWY